MKEFPNCRFRLSNIGAGSRTTGLMSRYLPAHCRGYCWDDYYDLGHKLLVSVLKVGLMKLSVG